MVELGGADAYLCYLICVGLLLLIGMGMGIPEGDNYAGSRTGDRVMRS